MCSAEFYRSRIYCHCMVKLEGSGSEEWSCEYCEFNMVQNRNIVQKGSNSRRTEF